MVSDGRFTTKKENEIPQKRKTKYHKKGKRNTTKKENKFA